MDIEVTCLKVGWGLTPMPLPVKRLSFWAMLELGNLYIRLHIPILIGACSVPCFELGLPGFVVTVLVTHC